MNKIDHYISRSELFAQPILIHVRNLVHTCCPEVEETIKWSFPHFVYNGANLLSMAAFKRHCSVIFWLADQMDDPHGILQKVGQRSGMGNLGKITSLEELPTDDVLIAYINHAMQLNDMGVKQKRTDKTDAVAPLQVPDTLAAAIAGSQAALSTWERLPRSAQKDYILWIEEAKTETTRTRRIDTAIEWLEEGKQRNWKYMKK